MRDSEEDYRTAADKAYAILLADEATLKVRIGAVERDVEQVRVDCRTRHPIGTLPYRTILPRRFWNVSAKFVIIAIVAVLGFVAVIVNAEKGLPLWTAMLERLMGK